MLPSEPQSLSKRLNAATIIIFFILVIANTSVLIWSYSTVWQYVKMIILVEDPSLPSEITALPALPSYRLQITEFSLSLNDIITNFWRAPAMSAAAAIFVSTYFLPYIKVIVYIIVFFIPLKYEHQILAVFQINQCNKLMFVPLVAILIQCATFSFTIVPPTHLIQEMTDTTAEAYPGPGLVTNMFNIFAYAFIDYFLYFIVTKTKNKRIQINYDQTNESINIEIQKKYGLTSYLSILLRSIFLVFMIMNIWLFFEAVTTAPVRFELDGVLAKFVPDRYIINNLFETGHILLDTSLLNDTTAWFLYSIYITVFFVCPCIGSVLLIVIWALACFNIEIVRKYLLGVLWFMHSWAAFDVFLLCQFGGTQSNIESATKYLMDSTFPQYCGVNGLVTKIFGQDCSWADAWFDFGLGLYILNVLVQFGAILYTNQVFSYDY